MRSFITVITWIVLVHVCLVGGVRAEGPSEYVIIPGDRVGNIKIGIRYTQQAQPQGLKIEPTADGRIKKISVSSPRYAVQYNQLRVGDSLQKIFRYYEKLDKADAGNELILLRSNKEGIEFVVNRTRDVIEEIRVYEAVIPNAYKQQVRPQKTKKSAEEQKQMKNFYIDSFK